jgi:6-phosphogluconolactonase (cycloisomerase 2 family)
MQHIWQKRRFAEVALVMWGLALTTAALGQPVQETLFVANNVSDNISVFTVNADGTLTEVVGSPFPAGQDTEALALSPDGRYLVATNAGLPEVEQIWLFEVGTTGALTPVPGNPWLTGNAPLDLDMSPWGYIYSPCSTDDQLRVFEIRDNALVELRDSPYGTPFFPHEVDTSADGAYVYFSHLSGGIISAYSVGVDGRLSVLPGAPFSLPGSGFELKVTPDGKNLYVGLGLGNAVAGYAIETDGTLVPLAGSPFPSGATSAVNLAINPSGQFVFVAHVVSDGVTTMARDPAGGLSFVPGSFQYIGRDVRKIVADDQFVFVTDESGVDPGVGVMIYSYDDQGLLTLIPGSPFAAGSRPKDMELFIPQASIPGDLDEDGDVDLDDYELFAACMAGPGASVPPAGCTQGQFDRADLDDDIDVDLSDFGGFQDAFAG